MTFDAFTDGVGLSGPRRLLLCGNTALVLAFVIGDEGLIDGAHSSISTTSSSSSESIIIVTLLICLLGRTVVKGNGQESLVTFEKAVPFL